MTEQQTIAPSTSPVPSAAFTPSAPSASSDTIQSAGAAPIVGTANSTTAASSQPATEQPLQPPMPIAAMQQVAEAQPAQPQIPNAQDAIIAQLQAQNAALLQQTQALNAQVVQFIQGGAQLATQQGRQIAQPVTPPQVQQMLQMGAQPDPLGTFNPPSLANGQDMSLEALASQIGKQD